MSYNNQQEYSTPLNQISHVSVVASSDGYKYVFNGFSTYESNKKHYLSNGTYILKNVPVNHPMAIISNGDITYSGDPNTKLTREVDGTNYHFYYNDITLTVSGNFGHASVYCYYHGYMGGQNILSYNLSSPVTTPSSPVTTPSSPVIIPSSPVITPSSPVNTTTQTSTPTTSGLNANTPVSQVPSIQSTISQSNYQFLNKMTSFAAQPGWSRPYLAIETTSDMAPFGKPRPIKHWRKQLVKRTSSGPSKSAITVPFNQPGSTVSLGVDSNGQVCSCNDSENIQTIVTSLPGDKNVRFSEGTKLVGAGPNGSTVCIACNPENNIIRSGMTEKNINSQSANEAPTKKFSFSTQQYLRSKCKSFDQRLTGRLNPGTQYVTGDNGCCIKPVPYSDNINGSQVRLATNCPDETCDGNPVKIIVKPNNRQFFQQGAVSSSSRLERLKLNTINEAASSLKKEYGSAAANAAKYTQSGATPYFIKVKPVACNPSIYYKYGQKTLQCS